MKNRKARFIGFSLTGFALFFITISITTSCSLYVYNAVNKATNGNSAIISWAVIGCMFAGALICCVIDIFRRIYTVENPVQKILDATVQIASGNFDVRLETKHVYGKYDQYDHIMRNINKMVEELGKNEILKTDFIANVSHEIKTPISVIQNYAKALQNENLSKEKKKEYLDVLVGASKKLTNLVSNILKLNKLENQKIVPELEKCDIAELLRQGVLQFESIIEEKNLELDCDIDEICVTTNAGYLELVFNNLISNAIKFTDNGGKITIKLKEDENFVSVSVRDSGCGISKETGSHIFDKFYQGDSSHAGEGNGLGLALVKKVVDTLGGEILVESTVGVGSKFTVKLKKD